MNQTNLADFISRVADTELKSVEAEIAEPLIAVTR